MRGYFFAYFLEIDMALRTPLTVSPHMYIGDSTGRPLDLGMVYFGEPDKDPQFYPIDIFSDDELTVPVTQPVRTKGGYLNDNKGDMAEIHAEQLIYSVKVLDQYGRKIFYKGQSMRSNWNDDVIIRINEAVEKSQQVATDLATSALVDIKSETAASVQDAINNTAVEGGVLADTFLTATAYHADTYARTQRSIRADTISLLDFIPLNLHAGIKSYTFADDVGSYMQKAVNYCTANNKELYCPAGGYMINPLTNNDRVGVFLINNWGKDRNLIVTGAGQGLTVFREANGATTIGGRYTKMFYIQTSVSASVTKEFGNIIFKNMSLDKNARSNTNPLRQAKIDAGLPITTADRFPFEQAHAISLGGVGNIDIESVFFEGIEIIDKIGAGISLTAAPTVRIHKVTLTDIRSRRNSKVELFGGDGTFGDRGCIEIDGDNGVIDLNSCDVQYCQIEPVKASSPTLVRQTNVNGGRIDALEFTDSGGYSYVNIVNLNCPYKLLTRGVDANITNSTFTAKEPFSSGTIKISNSTIKLPYNSVTNTVTAASFSPLGVNTAYGEMWLNNVDIVIDNQDPTLKPLGALLTSSNGLIGSRLVRLDNVRFDSRAEISVGAYAAGDWNITNSTLYGSKAHVTMGAFNVYGGSVELNNNRYMGAGAKVELLRNTGNFTLKASGSYPYLGFYSTLGVTSSDGKVLGFPNLYSPTKPTGYAPKGQTVINSNPTSGSYEKWIKTVEDSTSATWKGVGLIEGVAAAITSGTTAQRPTDVAVGFTYFDTTLGKPVYFKSTGVWVDSTGATV